MAYNKTIWENLPSTNTPINKNNLNKMENGIANISNAIGVNEYDNTVTYNVGDYCIYDNKLYKCNTTILVAENWNVQHWDLTTVITEINNIVESGSNANGNYIKYADGTMICYGRASMSFALSIAYGSVFRADIQEITLPESFIDTNYRVQIQALAPVHVCYAVDTDKTINSFKFYPVAFVSQTVVGIRSMDFVAFGKWK